MVPTARHPFFGTPQETNSSNEILNQPLPAEGQLMCLLNTYI